LPGLEAVLSNELASIGIPHSPTQSGANIRRASVETITKCHLFCGSASHVLLRCGGKAFNIRGFLELTRKVGRIPWETYLGADVILKVRATCAKSKLFHTTAVEERVEAAIYKSLGRSGNDTHETKGSGSRSSSSRQTVELLVRVHRDVVQLSIDTSKTPLHQRAYRLETAKAPLREDIAFSMLYAAGLHNSYQKLIDPMCGSGTIAIEGAAIKLGLPPGRLRDPPLEGTVFYEPELWNELLSQALEKSETLARDLGSDPIVMAGDRDEGATKSAIANAERAGVLKYMDISTRSVSDHDWSSNTTTESVLVATNPPFGKRVSSSREKTTRRFDELLPLYQTLGNKISGMKGNVGAAVLTNNVDLARRTGLKDVKALFSTQHGGLPVAAMGSNLQNPIFADSLKIFKKS
jgi:putative N6-adenine-specific DNA methylase